MEVARPATRHTTPLSIAALLILTLSGSIVAQSVHVPTEVSARIGTILPEASNAGAAYVDSIYSPNIVVDEACTVEVVFLWEGAGYRNAVGWFSFREEADGSVTITDRNLIWANASLPGAGNVQIGDLRPLLAPDGQLRVFDAGERIGFFLVADGYSLDDKRTPQPGKSDLADILARWQKRSVEKKRVRTDQSFLVPKAEIVDNDYDLSINRYKEVEYEAVEYDPPKLILERLAKLEEEIAKGREGLERML